MLLKESREVELITTKDGSHSLYLPSMDETYHSTNGAINESQYVFIKQGLANFSEHHEKTTINILEVGLGTGLNLFLSAVWAEGTGAAISYTALEPFPIPTSIVSQLNYPSLINKMDCEKDFNMIHTSPWEELVSIGTACSFTKFRTKLEDFTTNRVFDIVYFDAFAPNKQPEIWDKANLAKLYQMIGSQGILVTYCAQGQFKRDLQQVGFAVEPLPGPAGKFEMVRGLKPTH